MKYVAAQKKKFLIVLQLGFIMCFTWKAYNLELLFQMVSQIVSMISSNNLYDRVIVSSFFPWVSFRVKFADPKILTGNWNSFIFPIAASNAIF